MATWHYSGRTPTPIEIPGRGSVVLTKGKRFEAPESSVAHLVSVGMVKRMPDPPAPREPVKPTENPVEAAMVEPAPSAMPPQEAPPVPKAEPEAKVEVESDGDSGLGRDVVGSTESAPQVSESAEAAEAGSEGGPAALPPVEKKKQRSERQSRRRDPDQT